MPPAELNELREECLRHLRLLRVEVDDSQRQLEKLHLPLSAQSRVALLAQLQLNVQRAFPPSCTPAAGSPDFSSSS